MAKIPTYDNLTVQERALEAPRQTGAIEGAFVNLGDVAMARGAQAVADTAATVGGNEQRLEFEAKAKERDNKLAAAYRDLLHAPETGFLNQAGKNAIDGRKGTVEAIDKIEQQFLSEEMSAMERRNFLALSARRKESALLQIDTHTSHQTREFSINQTAARAESQVQDMSANWGGYNDPNSTYSTAKATGLREIENLAALNGWDKDITDGKKRAFLSGAHKTVIDNMLANEKTTDAKAYFEKFGGEIDERTKDGIKKELRTGSVKSESLGLQFELEAKYGGNYDAAIRDLKGRAKDKSVSAEIHDATLTRLEHARSQAEHRTNKAELYSLGQAYDWISKNPDKPLMDMPTQLRTANLKHLPSLEAFSKNQGRGETDDGVYYKLSQMSAAEFSKVNLLDYRNSLSSADFKRFSDRQSQIERGDDKAMRESATVKNINLSLKQMEGELQQAKIFLTPKKTDTNKVSDRDKFMGQVLRLATEEQEATQKPVTQERVKQIASQLLTKISTDPEAKFFTGDMPRWKAASLPYENIPSDQKTALRKQWDSRSEEQKAALAQAYRTRYGKEPAVSDLLREMWAFKMTTGAQ